jgi:flagellar biosynthesis protein
MDKKNQAVAMTYDPSSDSAPIPVAKGEGPLADEIVRKARENDIPILVDEALIPFLMRIPLQEEIPPQLYRSVAVIFSRLMEADRILAGKTSAVRRKR